ncbi:hypothetical protein [Streptomyces sp. NPDC087859]|jgi:hypothetical protein|uniref:hypothetical protein n=1 Tax=Streptomyces sp. NPDC087859 TaxID=3365812 RepID=UPI00382A9C2E
MRHEPNRTGVCLIRVEVQGGGVLVTVRQNPDIEQASTERVLTFPDVESAVEAVREFLGCFADDAGRL